MIEKKKEEKKLTGFAALLELPKRLAELAKRIEQAKEKGEDITPKIEGEINLMGQKFDLSNSEIAKKLNEAIEKKGGIMHSVKIKKSGLFGDSSSGGPSEDPTKWTGLGERVGSGYKPTVKKGSWRKKTEEQRRSIVEPKREIIVDTFDEEDHILVVGELPGVEEKDAKYKVKGDILIIETTEGDKSRSKEIPLSSPVDAKNIESSYRNGILEIKLMKTKGSEIKKKSSKPKK